MLFNLHHFIHVKLDMETGNGSISKPTDALGWAVSEPASSSVLPKMALGYQINCMKKVIHWNKMIS